MQDAIIAEQVCAYAVSYYAPQLYGSPRERGSEACWVGTGVQRPSDEGLEKLDGRQWLRFENEDLHRKTEHRTRNTHQRPLLLEHPQGERVRCEERKTFISVPCSVFCVEGITYYVMTLYSFAGVTCHGRWGAGDGT